MPACPSCNHPATGKFCNNCGTALGAPTCPKCGAQVRAGARFCAGCGTPAPGGGPVPGGANRTPWIIAAVAGAAVLVLLAVILARGEPGGTATVSSATAPFASGGGTPPDLSTMTPREQFDRLYNRVMAAAEQGDEATVAQFTPMAIQAYDNLDAVDADARYHLALLKVHTGDIAGVKALADTILQQNPKHLFGFMIRGSIARFEKDSVALRRSYRDFQGNYAEESAANRQEYQDHARSVADFKAAAEGS